MKRLLMSCMIAGGLISTSLAQVTADTIAFWDFENSTETGTTPTNGQPFCVASGGQFGTLDAVDGILMRGYSQVAGPSFASGISPFGGFAMHAVNQDGYIINDNSLVPWSTTWSNWTLEAHVYIDEAGPAFETFVAKMGATFGGNEGDFYFQRKGIDNNELRINYLPTGATGVVDRIIVDGTTTLNPGQWYGLAVAADSDAGTITLYVDDGNGYVQDGQTTGLTQDLGILSTTFDLATFRDYWGGGIDSTSGYMDNLRFSQAALSLSELIVAPYKNISFSPTGTSSDPNQTIEATFVNYGSEYVSAELFLDDGASPVATDNTPSGTGTNTISYSASGLSISEHTAKVVVIGANPTVTNTYEWSFEISQPPFDSITIISPNNGGVVLSNTAQLELEVVENFSTVSNTSKLFIDSLPLSTTVDRSLAPTVTVSAVTTPLDNGEHIAKYIVDGSPSGSFTNEWTFDVIVDDVDPTVLVHHWDFNDGSGTTVVDRVGTADGTIIGTNHSWVAGSLDLLGGGSGGDWNGVADPSTNTAGSYVDLPNGIISSLPDGAVTIEATYESDAPTEWWRRVWDFGESSLAEGNSAYPAGTYIFLSQFAGTGPRIALSTNTLAADPPPPEAFNMQGSSAVEGLAHVVWVYDAVNQTSKLYVNGELADAQIVPYNPLSGINDENCWFGRSQFVDGMFDGRLDDIRIYTGIMTPSEVADRYAAVTGAGSTNPNIQSYALGSGSMTLIWMSEEGATYNIRSKTALTDGWSTNQANIVSGGTFTTGTVSTAGSTEFFQIQGQ